VSGLELDAEHAPQACLDAGAAIRNLLEKDIKPRDILTRARQVTGQRLADVRVAGGAARSDAWCQIKADVVGAPVVRTAEAETGLIGAALAAATGLRWHATLQHAARAMCRAARTFEPRVAYAALYDARAAEYARAQRHAVEDADARVERST